MKLLLAAIGVLMLIVGAVATGKAFGWYGTATHDSIQAVGGPMLAGLGVALVWVTVMGRTQ